jgi:anti-anti-sigma regulatory factor
MAGLNVLSITSEPVEEAQLIRLAGELDLSTEAAIKAELDALRDEDVTKLFD